MVVLALICKAQACKDFRTRSEPILISRYHDSSVLSRKLNEAFSGVGNYLALSDSIPTKKLEESPFKGLYVLNGKGFKEDSLLDCEIGKYSSKYAHIVRGGIFVKITIRDIVKAKGRPASWNDLRVFMDLGTKLQTPKKIAELKSRIEMDSIHIDTVYPAKENLKQDPWFGVFYKETSLKSFIYGIKFTLRNDTLEYSYHEPYFGFRKSDFLNNYLDGASALYIMDTVAYNNVKKLAAFIARVHE
jgi:hypothetical protein